MASKYKSFRVDDDNMNDGDTKTKRKTLANSLIYKGF
jgi:hypothetical protein